MRAAWFTTSYPQWDGDMAGHFVRSLARCMSAEQGVQVTVFCPASPVNAAGEDHGPMQVRRVRYFWPARWQKLAGGDGIPWNLRHSLMAWVNLPMFFGRFKWRMMRQRGQADIVHAHWGVLGALAVTTRRAHRAKVVLTVHGSDLRSKIAVVRKMTEWAIRRADAVAAVSPELADECRAVAGANADNVHFIPNGVDLPDDAKLDRLRVDAPATPGRPHLVSVGRLISERRHDLLLEALAAVRSEFPDAALTLVGDGPQRAVLERQAEELGLAAAVRFAGQVPTNGVRGYLLSGDLYVSPTTVESFGLAVAEAAACGLPVVATDVGLPGKLVIDGEGGYVVPPGDGDALTQAVRNMLSDPDRMREGGQAMRRRVREMGLTWPAAAARTAELYRRLLEDTECTQ